tara:strand:+ start:297 stop:437 length:141 start_codon:yes stop_codon:yes gene_type:complete
MDKPKCCQKMPYVLKGEKKNMLGVLVENLIISLFVMAVIKALAFLL